MWWESLDDPFLILWGSGRSWRNRKVYIRWNWSHRVPRVFTAKSKDPWTYQQICWQESFVPATCSCDPLRYYWVDLQRVFMVQEISMYGVLHIQWRSLYKPGDYQFLVAEKDGSRNALTYCMHSQQKRLVETHLSYLILLRIIADRSKKKKKHPIEYRSLKIVKEI